MHYDKVRLGVTVIVFSFLLFLWPSANISLKFTLMMTFKTMSVCQCKIIIQMREHLRRIANMDFASFRSVSFAWKRSNTNCWWNSCVCVTNFLTLKRHGFLEKTNCSLDFGKQLGNNFNFFHLYGPWTQVPRKITAHLNVCHGL